jgi:hypothetical protein
MSQAHFNLQQKCNQLEAINVDLYNEKEVLKIKVETLTFEVDLLKDLVGYKDNEDKDAIIASLKQAVDKKA